MGIRFVEISFIGTVLFQIRILVTDVNDNPPILEQELYEIDIPENTRVNAPILQIMASDRDATDRLVFTLPSTSDPASRYRFRIDTHNGYIYLNESLDHESQRQHVLNVEVKDYNYGTHRTYARVVVNVMDSNDHMPEFSAESYEGKVYETAAVGTRVVDVYAFDRDQGSNAELTYSIVQGNSLPHGFSLKLIIIFYQIPALFDIESYRLLRARRVLTLC